MWHALLWIAAQAAGEPPTFTRDVAPILWANCAACHRSGEVAPFALWTYADAKKRAAQIVEVTDAGIMPPWIPTAESVPFVGERRLSEGDKRILREWVEHGAPEGSAADLPAPPVFPDGWQSGTPDLVVEMAESFVVPAEGSDVFRNFVLPVPLKEARWIRAVELRPDNPRVVHHAELLVDRSRSARRMDAREDGVGFDGLSAGQAAKPDGFFIGWTPGKLASAHPEGLAWRLGPGTDLVLQMHLVPTGRPENLKVKVGLWFAKRPPALRPVLARLGSTTIDVPAGEAGYTIRDQLAVTCDVQLLGLYPHAHFLARKMRADVVAPDGARRALLRIDDWDFDWQDEYRLREPMALAAGSRIEMQYEYDNSEANLRNPHHPPRRVSYGPNSKDEMGDLWLALLPKTVADSARLEAELGRREATARRVGFELAARLDPDSAQAHLGLGSASLAEGELDRAVTAYRRAIELDPQCAQAHYDLGVILLARRDSAAAVRAFDSALKAAADYPEAWNNRGAALLAQNDLVGAMESFRRALEQHPDYADAHYNLGNLKARARDLTGARAHFERALAAAPEHVEATFNLGNVFLQMGERSAALARYRRVLELAPGHAGATEMLRRVEGK